ncbi:MAG: murein biosynthesis integral membrane protein MurJ [Verrucomicrobia bacterium]|nr:murein biosynthesis integral membrane protein MurJ [Verrucomicrobiota bacterium]
MSQMLKSSGAMGAATLASRVLGMVREILYARFMGAGPVAGAFTMAFMIPNLFRRLLGEGALTAAFIPIFKEKQITAGEAEMWRSANAVISGLIIAASAIIGLVLIAISVVLALDTPVTQVSANPLEIATGTSAQFGLARTGWLSGDTRLMLQLLQVMFPYMLLVCVAAIFMGMLNARGHFFVPAMGTTVLNIIMISAVLWLAPQFGQKLETQIFGLAIGVLVAGVAQALYLVPTLRREGFHYQWVPPWGNETVQEVVRKMVPGMMGVAAFQFNVLFNNSIAFALDPQIVASFGYAVRLMELPQGVFGVSLATFLLPTLAGLAAEKKFTEFRATLGQALGYLALGNLIASVLLTVLAQPIVRLLFERGEFDVIDTQRSSFALACLAPGLIAFSMVNILARAFYALGDTKTPMKISTVCLILNVVLTFWLIVPFAEGGLGIANTLSAGCNVWLLFYALRRKLRHLDLAKLKREMLGMTGAAIVAGEVAWLVNSAWERSIGHASLMEKLAAVFLPLGVASLVYGLILLWLKVPQAQDFFQLLRQKVKLGKRRDNSR